MKNPKNKKNNVLKDVLKESISEILEKYQSSTTELKTSELSIGLIVKIVPPLMDSLFNQIEKHKEQFSKWIMAGCMAISYLVISDPEKAMKMYGYWETKACFILTLSSIYFGFQVILQVKIYESLENAKELHSLLEELSESEEQPKLVTEIQSVVATSAEMIVNKITSGLFHSKEVIIQTLLFTGAVMILFIKILLI